jgi:hypothetical protein
MDDKSSIDGVLLQWGDRLFYPGNRIVRPREQPRLGSRSSRQQSDWIRERIEAAVRRAPQVMVKVTGGGRGMKAIAAHLRYISKNGRLEIEDDEGRIARGKDALREIADEWRYGGGLIPRSQPSTRSVQHHALHAAWGCRSSDCREGGPPIRQGRARRAQVRDGSARPSSQPACPHQRSGGVEGRSAPQST